MDEDAKKDMHSMLLDRSLVRSEDAKKNMHSMLHLFCCLVNFAD
jgi:hypothetical protein